jgi:hypothetical protein
LIVLLHDGAEGAGIARQRAADQRRIVQGWREGRLDVL